MKNSIEKYKNIILPIIIKYIPQAKVILYGSRARQDAREGSDIDIIVITDKKIKLEKKKPFDLIQIERDKINTFKKINPVLFYSFVFSSDSVF